MSFWNLGYGVISWATFRAIKLGRTSSILWSENQVPRDSRLIDMEDFLVENFDHQWWHKVDKNNNPNDDLNSISYFLQTKIDFMMENKN